VRYCSKTAWLVALALAGAAATDAAVLWQWLGALR
jgi:hypothetical protein